MAITTVPLGEVPKFVLLTEYAVSRSGEFPAVRATFEEMVYMMEELEVAGVVADSEGKFIKLEIPALANRANLSGRILATLSSDPLTNIASVETVELTPAVQDEGAGVVIPATYTAKVTLTSPLVQDLTGTKIGLVGRMPVGTPTYRRAKGGRRGDMFLDGSNPQAMGRISTMLGGVQVKMFATMQQVLVKQGKTDLTTLTLADIMGVVQALGAQGINIDGLLAEQGEALLLDHRAKMLPFVATMGDLPS